MKKVAIYIGLIMLAVICGNCQDNKRNTIGDQTNPDGESKEGRKDKIEQRVDSLHMLADILQKQITDNPERISYTDWYSFEKGMNGPAMNRVLDWKIEEDSITVWLVINTEESVAAFRQEIIDSPLIRFRKSSFRIPFAEHYFSDYKDGSSYGYELKLSQNVFTLPMPETLTATLFNYTDIDGTTGARYWVDYNNNGTWEVIEFISNDGYGTGFPDIGYFLLSHSKHVYTVNLYPGWYDYRPGEYRIRRGFLIDGHYIEKGQSRIWDSYYAAAHFTILE